MLAVRVLCAAFAALLLAVAPAAAEVAERPWPPADGPGLLFAHFAEEHVNDEDGPTLLPKVVEEVTRYRPALVTMSGDKANDGERDQLALWQDVMGAFDRAGIPYLAGAGNHDRDAPPGVPGGTIGLFGATTPDSLDPYKSYFAGRPYPMGDAAPYDGGPFAPLERPADDPEGAAATYAVDVGPVRWIFLDNSCWSLSGCDPFQARADGGRGSQLDFLRAKATEARDAGRMAFVVMHMPTQDPRDQSYTDTTATNHVMGKGATADNDRFERIAEETGVDGVFLGHIKGQFLYEGRGGVPYFIDGGAGGELYTTGPVGTDHGYWHGFRLVRVEGRRIAHTDVVPIFVPGSIRIDAPERLAPGAVGQFAAFGRQPVFKDPAKVEALELRDPDPTPKPRRGLLGGVAASPWALWLGPLALLGGFALLVARAGLLRRGPRTALGATLGLAVLTGAGGAALAQQEVPTSTPREALPTPARIWETSDPRVLAPVAAEREDPRRDPRTQTVQGRFRARCPGTATVSVTSGFERSSRAVTVPSRAGRLTSSVRRGARTVRRGRAAVVARVRPAQPVVTRVRVRRGKEVVATLKHGCTGRPVAARWDARNVASGRYRVEVHVLSDRKPVVRRYALRVR